VFYWYFSKRISRFQPVISTFLLLRFNGIDLKMFNFDGKKKNIYGKTMESFLFNQAKAWKQQH